PNPYALAVPTNRVRFDRTDGRARVRRHASPSRRRYAGAAFVLAALLLLSGCLTAPPKLGTSADGFLGVAQSGTSVTLRNDGGGRLEWRARTDDPAVSVAPSRGQLGAGASVDLRIT